MNNNISQDAEVVQVTISNTKSSLSVVDIPKSLWDCVIQDRKTFSEEDLHKLISFAQTPADNLGYRQVEWFMSNIFTYITKHSLHTALLWFINDYMDIFVYFRNSEVCFQNAFEDALKKEDILALNILSECFRIRVSDNTLNDLIQDVANQAISEVEDLKVFEFLCTECLDNPMYIYLDEVIKRGKVEFYDFLVKRLDYLKEEDFENHINLAIKHNQSRIKNHIKEHYV